MKIVIIGFGIVGKNMHKVFPEAVIHDPPQKLFAQEGTKFDIAFVCVPTPSNPDGSCDYSVVEKVVAEHNPGIFCIRSTIPPGTTEMLQEKYKKPCVFSPEYYGSTIHANAQDYDFITLGGDRIYTSRVAELFSTKYPGWFIINQVTAKEAEIAKYMENCWLAVKVSFCNEFKNICDAENVDYFNVRKSWLLDPRINPSHTWVFKDQPGWNSICLNKDVPAMIRYAEKKGVKTDLIKAAMKYKRI